MILMQRSRSGFRRPSERLSFNKSTGRACRPVGPSVCAFRYLTHSEMSPRSSPRSVAWVHRGARTARRGQSSLARDPDPPGDGVGTDSELAAPNSEFNRIRLQSRRSAAALAICEALLRGQFTFVSSSRQGSQDSTDERHAVVHHAPYLYRTERSTAGLAFTDGYHESRAESVPAPSPR